jgi:antitoxin (DNA-binding transcriptional repressor) of toxin-antitoxin stability system
MKHQTVSVTEFKAKCLALFDQIDQEGGTLTVTRRGKPLVTVGPVKKKPFKSSMGIFAGMIDTDGLDEEDRSDMWEAVTHPELILNPEKRKK